MIYQKRDREEMNKYKKNEHKNLKARRNKEQNVKKCMEYMRLPDKQNKKEEKNKERHCQIKKTKIYKQAVAEAVTCSY